MADRIDQPDDIFFKPANLEVREGRGAEARPMADLTATAHHNDQLMSAEGDALARVGPEPLPIPSYGTPPSQDNPARPNPKPVLDPSPNYGPFQMNQNVASEVEPRLRVVAIRENDAAAGVPDDPGGEPVQNKIEGPEVLED